MLFLTRVIFIFLAGTCFAAAAPAQEFFVSPAGDDANPGTKAKPFSTLAHVRDAVRIVNQKMSGDTVVNLRGKNYCVTQPLEFGTEDSGRNGFNVVYRAYKNETPIISSGVSAKNWTRDHGRIYSAK